MSWENDKLALALMLPDSQIARPQKKHLSRHYSLSGISILDSTTASYYANDTIRFDVNKMRTIHPSTFFKTHRYAYMFAPEDISLTPELGKYVLTTNHEIWQWIQTYKCSDCHVVSLKKIESHIGSMSCAERKIAINIKQSKDWSTFAYKFRGTDYNLDHFFQFNYILRYADATNINGQLYAKKELLEACKAYALNKIKSNQDIGTDRNTWNIWSDSFLKHVLYDRDEYLEGLGFELKYKLNKAVDSNFCQCGAKLDNSKWAYSDGATTIRLCTTHGQALAVCFDKIISTTEVKSKGNI